MKMKKTVLILSSLLLLLPSLYARDGASQRQQWADLLYRISEPVLREMAGGTLQKNMLLELSPTWDGRNEKVSYMEAFGRTLCGVAPWLSLPDDSTPEGAKRRQLRLWALEACRNAVDPDSPDYLLWRSEGQTLVDAAFLAQGFLRGWDALWVPLDTVTKKRYIEEFTLLRRVNPVYSNWLLFSATIECFLKKAGAQADDFRIATAIRKIEEWYVGDGWYSDGPHFEFNYYNAYVIQPMYLECVDLVTDHGRKDWWGVCPKERYSAVLERIQRQAVILERLISPEGSFPVFGRSIPYRMAALQPLSQLSLRGELPGEIAPSQVREALSAVMERMFSRNGNFNEEGFLTIGFCGHQSDVADVYTNNGSAYLTTVAFLPLGLPSSDPFWSDPPKEWTGKKAWSGEAFPKDHAWK